MIKLIIPLCIMIILTITACSEENDTYDYKKERLMSEFHYFEELDE